MIAASCGFDNTYFVAVTLFQHVTAYVYSAYGEVEASLNVSDVYR